MRLDDLARLVLGSRGGLVALVVRVATGVTFIAFGASKFIHHGKETATFARYGLPFPSTFVIVIGLLELGCGILLVLGLATRLGALSLAGDMVGAIANGGRVDGGFLNLVLAPVLLVAMLALLRLGGGRLALDGPLLARLQGQSQGGPELAQRPGRFLPR